MQDVHILCSWEEVRERADAYEREFAENEVVLVLEWGCSYKRQQGYIVLEWEGHVDEDFLARLEADASIVDYCVYDVPCVTLVGASQLSWHCASFTTVLRRS